MNWTNKDWLDLVLMALGACLGVAVFGFAIAPALGLTFASSQPANYMASAVAGTLGGYMLRIAVSPWRRK